MRSEQQCRLKKDRPPNGLPGKGLGALLLLAQSPLRGYLAPRASPEAPFPVTIVKLYRLQQTRILDFQNMLQMSHVLFRGLIDRGFYERGGEILGGKEKTQAPQFQRDLAWSEAPPR